MTFTIVPGQPDSPVILHVPHASTRIPPDARESILLDDVALDAELALMTDTGTDVIAGEAGGGPWRFVNGSSRLVVDPERFPDEREEMAAVGMGAVYLATSHRERLRNPDPARDQRLFNAYFHPYAAALTALVDGRLARCGRAVIIDVHSYPRQALPYELHIDLRRPAVCLGTDGFHTPGWLLGAAQDAFGAFEPLVNEPFIGTYVPLKHYAIDSRVSSIMVEMRRDVCEGRRSELVLGLAALVQAGCVGD